MASHWPHTTILIWGTHRITYIFTDATGSLSLYYDIELKEPLESRTTGGSMFPTTTIISKKVVFMCRSLVSSKQPFESLLARKSFTFALTLFHKHSLS
jgi:hypothetical protein